MYLRGAKEKTEISQGNVRICQQRGKKLVVKSRRNSLKFFHRQSKTTPEIFSVTLQNYVSNPIEFDCTTVFKLRQNTQVFRIEKQVKKQSLVGLTCIFMYFSKCIAFFE